MKKSLLVIIYVLFLNFTIRVYAQQNTYNHDIWDSLQYGVVATAVTPAFDNGFIITGTYLINYPESGGLVFKVDSAGNIAWNKVWTGNAGDNYFNMFNAIIPTNDSCYMLVGSTYLNRQVGVLMKISSNGDTLWSKYLAYPPYDLNAINIEQTSDSGFIITGSASDTNSTSSMIMVVKTDKLGNLQWSGFFKSNTFNDGVAIKQAPDGGYLLTGYMGHAMYYYDCGFLMKLSPSGDIVWAKEYYCTGEFSGEDLLVIPDGILLFSQIGESFGFIKTDSAGNITGIKYYPELPVGPCKIHKTMDHGYLVNCTKIDSNGIGLWNNYNQGSDEFQTKDEGYFIVTFYEIEILRPDAWINCSQIGIIKPDSAGNTSACYANKESMTTDTAFISSAPITFSVSSGVAIAGLHLATSTISLEDDSGCVEGYGAVHEYTIDNKIDVYPNPSSDAFTISCEKRIKEGALMIISSLGQTVFTTSYTGNQKTINPNLAPGIYFVEIIAGDNRFFTKIIRQ